MNLLFAPLVCLIGLVVYALTNNARVSELARIMFAVGLLALLLTFGGEHIAVGH